MNKKNKLDEISLAEVNTQELTEIKNLEQKLGEKYYLIAFER
jgi:hypothetical protein